MTNIQIEVINIVHDLSILDTKTSLVNICRLSSYTSTQVNNTLKSLEKSGCLTSDDNGRYAITEKSYSE